MYKQIDQEIKKIAKNDQTETTLGTYKQNTYTLSRGGAGCAPVWIRAWFYLKKLSSITLV
jgi:hypothetical protein